ncbi:MAG: cytochrome c biogenesis protein ResB [Acidithiobacillus ferriphilus]
MQAAVERPGWRVLVQFLGSMRLAVSLLVLLAIASVIGTILSQQQPYQNYAIQFGPFWFQVYRDLGLYNVYRTLWYTAIVAFLVLSTATCVTRNSPRMLREMREFPIHQHEAAILGQDHWVRMESALPLVQAQERVLQVLRSAGYKPRLEQNDGDVAIAARKGRYHRLGYFLTHLAIVVICGAALYNADVPVKWAEWQGTLKPEQDFNLPLSQIPKTAWMSPHNPAYRGIITLPEGQTANAVFELAGNGYLVQPLPFRIHLQSFHISFYSTGMPKDFTSRVVLYSPEGKILKTGEVRVNHPISYEGVEIYQSSFSDGGSLLRMKTFLLGAPGTAPGVLEGRVGQTLHAGNSGYSVDLKNFDLYNIVPKSALGEKATPDHPTLNLGPSFTYIVRDPAGKGAEFKTYMTPMQREGQGFFVQGYRSEFGNAYQYVYIPTGPNGGIGLFMDYLAALQAAARSGTDASQAIFVDTFREVVARDAPQMSADAQGRFLQASVQTLLQLHDYPMPFVLSLSSFDHRWAAGLQVTKWPGTTVIYWGCVALVLGIFILFYIPQKRVWLRLRQGEDGGTRLLMGASADRNRLDFAKEFTAWTKTLERALGVDHAEYKEQEDGQHAR